MKDTITTKKLRCAIIMFYVTKLCILKTKYDYFLKCEKNINIHNKNLLNKHGPQLTTLTQLAQLAAARIYRSNFKRKIT